MPLSDHLRKIIPGGICAAIGGFLLLFGGILYFAGYMANQQMAEMYAEFAQYGLDYTPSNSGLLSFAGFLLVLGFIFLAIGLGFLARGVSIYRNPLTRRRRLEAEEKRIEAVEAEDEEEELAPPPRPVRPQAASQCPRCGEILLDTMDICPSCKQRVETRLAAPAILPAAAEPVVQYKNYCMYCGNRIPDTPDLVYCPICGKKIIL